MRPNEQTARDRMARVVELAQGSTGWYGCWSLFRREIQRFMTIVGQSIVSPVLTTMLYFLVFGFSLGERLNEMGGVPYMDFLTPGLVMMAVITNSFINSGFSFFINKVHGAIVDLLAAPLSSLQIMIAYVGASLVRSSLTACLIWGIAAAFGASTMHAPLVTLAFIVIVSSAFSLFGLAMAILSEEFEQVNFVPSFVVIPFTFLGGVFYSVDLLPGFWADVALWNPFLYMVNGLRYGMAGVSDVSVFWSFVIAFAFMLATLALCWRILATGRKIRE